MSQPSRRVGLAFAAALLTALARRAALRWLRGPVVSVSGDALVVHAGVWSVSVALPAD